MMSNIKKYVREFSTVAGARHSRDLTAEVYITGLMFPPTENSMIYQLKLRSRILLPYWNFFSKAGMRVKFSL